MNVWILTLAAVAGISLLSLSGAFVMVLRQNVIRQSLLVLVSFAAGALLGDAFIHLLPEMVEIEGGFPLSSSFIVLIGMGVFLVLEKVLHWRHVHTTSESTIHPMAITNLVGDAMHNFVDGAIVAGAMLVSTKLGIATVVAVALHEIPQELGDFGVLVHAGLKPRRALWLNLLSASFAVLGAVLALSLESVFGGVVERFLVPMTAGGFVYIAGTDLIPELHKEPAPVKSLLQLLGLTAGVGVMALLLVLE
jgi:zinc and cadmium transporter